MKNILVFCILYVVTMSAYAETCPEIGGGYEFRVAAWGDHVKTRDKVRCYYYFFRDDTQHIKIESRELDESEITSHPEWSNYERHYHLCTSKNDKVNDCPFG